MDVDKVAMLSVETACKLAGISHARLRSWIKSGAFRPEYGVAKSVPLVYSFRDVVGLRVLAILRKKGVPLQQLRKVGAWLSAEHSTPWASLRFFVAGKNVLFEDKQTGSLLAVKPFKQAMINPAPFDIEPISQEMANKAKALTQRESSKIGTVEQRRGVMGGKWVVGGTRISSESIWRFNQAGYTIKQILKEYPSITEDDVRAALDRERSKIKKAG